jgi:hypothetical protein
MRTFRIPIKFDPTIIMYLVIVDKALREHAELVKTQPTEKFFAMIREQLVAHLSEGKAPPAEISGAIMNISDDVSSGRDVQIRAGDYIALMNYARKTKAL